MTKLQARMAQAKAKATAVANGEEQATQLSEEEIKSREMGYAYEAMLGLYLHRPALKYFVRDKKSAKVTTTFFLKAAKLADQLRVDYAVYVRAQFYWFDMWFHRSPRVFELSGESGRFPASRRVTEYQKLKREGKVNKDISSPVMPKKPADNIDLEVLDKINRQRLNQLCDVHGLTEGECLDTYGPAGLFDLRWLDYVGFRLPQREEGK